MAEKTLQFATGLVKYRINDTVDITFNPTDANFTEKLFRAFDDLDKKQAQYEKEVKALNADRVKTFEYARTRDAEMREIIDGILGEGVSDALFGDMNCYSMADGLPVWINLLFAIADEVHDAYNREADKTDPRVKTYTNKYNKLMMKYNRKMK